MQAARGSDAGGSGSDAEGSGSDAGGSGRHLQAEVLSHNMPCDVLSALPVGTSYCGYMQCVTLFVLAQAGVIAGRHITTRRVAPPEWACLLPINVTFYACCSEEASVPHAIRFVAG